MVHTALGAISLVSDPFFHQEFDQITLGCIKLPHYGGGWGKEEEGKWACFLT
jgi:hypothetical protein